jgi:protein O-GlcNAc transferase
MSARETSLHATSQESLTEALGLYRNRRLDEARILLESLVSSHPKRFDAHLLLARVNVDLRRWNGALAAATAALAGEGSAAAWYSIGRAYKGLGSNHAARSGYRRALLAEPRNAAILTSLGTALYEAGRTDEAAGAYRQALSADPGHAGARASLEQLVGPARADEARLSEIRAEAQRLQAAGRLDESLALHREALRLAPQAAGIWLSAGLLANELGQQAASLPLFEKAAQLNPTLTPAIEAARRIAVSAGLFDKAWRYSEQAYALRPSDDILIAKALTVPAIQPSVEAISASRIAYEAGLDSAIAMNLKVSDVRAAQIMGSFFLAYHGENDRRLQSKASALLTGAAPWVVATSPHCERSARHPGRIRIGFISAFLYSHSIGNTTRGLVAKLSREHFEVTVLRIMPSKRDEFTERMQADADRSVDLDADFHTARAQIAALELDILFYQDIGMEPMSYLLAHSRLAPVQCVSFGHPNTTGIASMDYFISNDLFEPEDAQDHYSERLFLLENLPTLAYYYRPELPLAAPTRTEFGLRDQDHVYVCPQTLFKLHAEFDAVMGGILRRDPLGIVVLIRGQYEDYTAEIERRFERSLGDVKERILFLDSMPSERFMQLLTVADVCLDTLHFNGMNSSLEAFSVGLPIVTLPGRLQRGRHTQAMYRKMGILDCIASNATHYVDIAVSLGCDKGYAREIRDRIMARNHVLYEDPRVVHEFERFFFHAVQVLEASAVPLK